jgi:hypothetical protein
MTSTLFFKSVTCAGPLTVPQERSESLTWVMVKLARGEGEPVLLFLEADGVAEERSSTQDVSREMVQGVLGDRADVEGRMM